MSLLSLIPTLLLALLLVAAPATSRELGHEEALQLRHSGQLLPFETVLGVVLERYPGARLLEVELDKDDGRYIYELELLTAGGAVRELEIDAGTGAILQDEAED